MEKYFDVHNHLFNKHFIAKELVYRMMKELKKLIHGDSADDAARDPERGIKNVITTLKRYRYALKVFGKKNSIAIYEELDKTYMGEFILTPLTFDLTWCFAPDADRAIDEDPDEHIDKELEKEMNSAFALVEDDNAGWSRDAIGTDLWQEFLVEKELFMKESSEMQVSIRSSNDTQRGSGTQIEPGANWGWNEQLRQIHELKNHPVYGPKVFPFLAVDPRRPGIYEYALQNVGKGKLFAGIKLYCPNGYSPTDPLLFGDKDEKGGIFDFCEQNGIPVTAHNSDGGFATLARRIEVDGLIHLNGQLIQMDKRGLKFKTSILDKDAIYERAVTLNHPLIWEKVAEKYPRLLLNLAHFGGGQQLDKAIANPENRSLWSNRIIDLVHDERYTVYTDISCFTDFRVLKNFFESPVFSQIKHKVLYGSDFTLLLLFENDFERNVEQFKNLFGADFDIIANTNPSEFLKYVLPMQT